ncbi:MAG: hypothetical protein FWF50_04805 [Defluviitaleaceae bacterium]|nr:hypothetical protein [Defluviitaleaceae bacterium]
MNFFIISTMLNIKKIIKKRTIYMAFILLPAISYLIDLSNNYPVNISVGIYSQGVTLEIENPLIRLIKYDDRKSLIEDVQTGIINFGYILSPIESTQNNIKLIKTELSFGYQLINELIVAAYLDYTLEMRTVNFLQNFFDYENIETFVREQINYYRQADIFMIPELQGIRAENITEINLLNSINNGIIGLIITAILIFITPYFIREKNSGVLLSLKYRQKQGLYYASLFSALFIVIFVISAISMRGINILSIATYVSVCVSLTIAAIAVLKKVDLVQNFGIFLIILNIFTLIDFSEFNELLGIMQRLFPLFWLLHF